MIISILFVLLMGVLMALESFLWAQRQALQRSEIAVRTLYYAQSGIEKCLAHKKIAAIDTTAVGRGEFVVQVHAFPNRKVYWIRSTGILNQKKRTISVWIKRLKNSRYKILKWQDSYLQQVTE